MNIDVTLHLGQSFARRLDDLIYIARNFSRQQDELMITLQDIVDSVAMETTAVESLSVFVKGLMDQIKAMPGITPVMQAQIDTIAANVEKNKAAITAAMAPAVVEPSPAMIIV